MASSFSSSSISLPRPLQVNRNRVSGLSQFHVLSAPEASRLLDCDRVLPVSGSLVQYVLSPNRRLTKVCDIVRKQLELPRDSAVTGESKFAALGADSLHTVEIVMGLEEEFGIGVEEETAQAIATVQDAADLTET